MKPTLSPETLRQIPLFQHLNNDEWREVAQVVRAEEFASGVEVLHQGGTCQNLWIVLEGECDVVKQIDNGQGDGSGKHEVVLATLRPNESFGEMSFFQPAPHSAAVRARGSVKLLRLKRADYDRLVEEGDGAAFKLAFSSVQCLAERLRRMDDWVANLLAHNTAKKPPGEWVKFREQLLQEWNL
jgi:CRP-like cAMP-binding protein